MLLVFGLTQANRVGWASAQTIGVFAASAVLMAVFLWNETRSRSPLVPLSIFKRRTLTGANIIGFGLGTMIFGMFFLLSLYMQQVLGFSAMETGFGYLAVALTVIVAATISQGLVTKLGVKPVLVVGMALLTIGLVYFTQVSVDGSYAVDLLPGFLIIGVGMGFSFVPISIAALAGVRGAGGRPCVRAHQHEPADRRRARPRPPDHRRHDAHHRPARQWHAAARGAHVRLQPGFLGRRGLRARLADHDDRRPSPEGHPGGLRRAGDRPGRLTVSQRGAAHTGRSLHRLAPLRIGSRLLDPREVVMARRAVLSVLALLVVLAVSATAAASGKQRGPTLEFLGEEILPTGLQFEGTNVGGLSSIAYDADRDLYYVIADDASVINPARYYTFALDVADGNLDPGDVVVDDVTTLLDAAGLPFAAASFDPEGLALTKDDELVITSEGIATRLIPPWVRLFGLDGRQLEDLPVPLAFIPDAIPQTRGVRQNLGFESAATVGPYFYTGSEGALVQDGPAAGIGVPSPARLLRYNLKTGRPDRQYVYVTDPIAEPPVPPTNFAVNGLVELLPLDKHSFLSMERSFSVGAPDTGNTIKLYTVEISGARNVNGREKLTGTEEPVTKELLLNLDALGIPLDNVEGMAFGPDLADGRRSLVLVSDNNFAPAQFTQFLLFAFSEK